MDNAEFSKIVENQIEHCRSLLCKKGKEYDAETDDRFHSFKVAAKLQNISTEQALAGMMVKHTISIYDMIGSECSNLALWDEKITDQINYLLLLKGLLMDKYGGQNE